MTLLFWLWLPFITLAVKDLLGIGTHLLLPIWEMGMAILLSLPGHPQEAMLNYPSLWSVGLVYVITACPPGKFM